MEMERQVFDKQMFAGPSTDNVTWDRTLIKMGLARFFLVYQYPEQSMVIDPGLKEACWRERSGCHWDNYWDQKHSGGRGGRDGANLCNYWDSTDSWGKLGISPWYPYFFTSCCGKAEREWGLLYANPPLGYSICDWTIAIGCVSEFHSAGYLGFVLAFIPSIFFFLYVLP